MHSWSSRVSGGFLKRIPLKVMQAFTLHDCAFASLSLCAARSSCIGEGQGEHSAPGKLPFWKQLVHKPQRERGVRLRRRLRLQLWIGAGRAAQQEEAPRGGQLDSGGDQLSRRTLFTHQPQLFLPVRTRPCLLTPVQGTGWRLCERGATMYKKASTLLYPPGKHPVTPSVAQRQLLRSPK